MDNYPLFDYHSHNGFSRCVHKPFTIQRSWAAAKQRGIQKLGITNHVHYNSPFQEFLPDLRQQIDKIGDPNLLLGVELDIDSEEGHNVLESSTYRIVDYVIAGPHNQPTGILLLPDVTEEEIGEYFTSLRKILLNSLEKISMQIWVHPFLQEFELFGDRFWDSYLKPLLLECLPICAKKQIAVEISAAFHREFKLPKGNPKWKDPKQYYPVLCHMLNEIYTEALKYPEIPFSFGSDAHEIENVGDIKFPMKIARELNIPSKRILNLTKKF